MDMPINIVPAPNSGLVALYATVCDQRVAEEFDVRFRKDSKGVEFYLRPVVGWCMYKDCGDVTNGPLVADESGALVLAGVSVGSAEDDVMCFADGRSQEFQGVCTLTEAELHVQVIATAAGVSFQRISNAEFHSVSVKMPNNFALTRSVFGRF